MMSSPPKVSIAALDEAVGKARLGDAAVDRDRFAAGRLDLGGDGVARRGVEIVDDDARALAGELQRDGPADAAAGSGDQRDLSLEFAHQVSFWCQMAMTASPASLTSPFSSLVVSASFAQPLAFVFDEFGDMALAGQARAELRDRDKAGRRTSECADGGTASVSAWPR